MKEMKTLIEKAEQGQYQALFRDLGWSKPVGKNTVQITVGSSTIRVDQVAQYRGLAIWVANELPGRTDQRIIDHQLAKQSAERLLIFHSPDAQDWRWPRHSKLGSVNARLMAHRHTTGQPDPDLETRLESMHIGIDEDPSINELLARMRLVFDQESETASAKAARLMGALYEQLSKSGMDATQSTQLLARLLFLWFGDDAGMWEENTFHQWVAEHTTPENLNSKLDELFNVVNDPHADDNIHGRPWQLPNEYRAFRYINGGIFAKHLDIPPLDPIFREQVLEACQFDWSIISPAIFGSMFQTVKDKESRRAMGEHYTTEENILKTLRPLFLDGLEERLEAAWNDKGQLTRLHKRLGSIRYLDPACGCGNFLIIAYRELRALELRLIERRRQLDELEGHRKGEYEPRLQFDGASDTLIKMSHFAGIEIEEWPAAIAETAMLLVDHLANQAQSELLGVSLVRLPIDDTNRANIVHTNALRIAWQEVIEPGEYTYVAGNPPFVGYDDRREQQRKDMIFVWETDKIGRLDYVTAWYKKAAQYLDGVPHSKFAFVSTNSVAQGEPVPLLFEPLFQSGWHIEFAYQTFVWTSEAPGKKASVHCVIIGMSQKRVAKPVLYKITEDGKTESAAVTKLINAYLIDAADVFVYKRSRSTLSSDIPPVKNGCVAGEISKKRPALPGLVMTPSEAEALIKASPIVSPFVREYVGGQDFLNGERRYCLWLPNGVPEALEDIPEIRSRLDNVRLMRSKSSEASTRALALTPWRFKHISQPQTDYICIPRTVTNNRRWMAVGYLEPSIIVSNGCFWAADPSGFAFAIISSSMFIAWQRAVGGKFKSDPRFANTIVWNNLPLPSVSDSLRGEICAAGQEILRARSLYVDKTLADLYDPVKMPTELTAAHQALDNLVDKAFSAQRECVTNEDRFKILFDRYQELLEAEQLSIKSSDRARMGGR